MLTKCPALNLYILSTTAQTEKRLFAQTPSLTYLQNLYNQKNINTKACWKNAQYYMCKYPLQQYKHKQKRIVSKIPSITCVYTLYKNTNIKKTIISKPPSPLFLHILYNNTNISTKMLSKDQVFHVSIH